MHTLHEHRPGGIYTVGELVFHIVLIPVNSEGHCGCVSSYDINEQRRLIQHIDIVVVFGDPEKTFQIQWS
jgi:hypothetical protein